jgi:hypothetical protein
MHNLAAYYKAHEFLICLCETAQTPPRSSSLDQFKTWILFPGCSGLIHFHFLQVFFPLVLCVTYKNKVNAVKS